MPEEAIAIDKPEREDAFTFAIDERIVSGLFDDEEAMLEEMEACGLHRDSVLQRALSLGLSNQILAQSRVSGIRPALRKCLSCEKQFLSAGPQNRMCNHCRPRG